MRSALRRIIALAVFALIPILAALMACATAYLDAVAIGGLADEDVVVPGSNEDMFAHQVAALGTL